MRHGNAAHRRARAAGLSSTVETKQRPVVIAAGRTFSVSRADALDTPFGRAFSKGKCSADAEAGAAAKA